MEDRKLVIFTVPLFLVGLFALSAPSASAYGIETHAYLTDEIINLYNQNHSDKRIPDELKNYLIDGSRKEDEVPRWLNHFYDPVYDRGLSTAQGIKGYKSKTWAQDASKQNEVRFKVTRFIASLLTAAEQRKISEISADPDFTWNRAIEFYVNGENEKAMFALGHVLHLIEDAGVPDHTRNDDHPNGSPYERFARRFNSSNSDESLLSRVSGEGPTTLDNLDAYFNSLAIYSNNNFYSKDTIGIQSGYNLPTPADYEIKGDLRFARGHDEVGFYKLFSQPVGSSYLLSIKGEIIIDNDDIMADYWSRLSPKTVQHGAGVVDLFFQEAEKAKNDPKFAKKEKKNFLTQAVNAAKTALDQIFNRVDNKPVAVIDVNKQNQQEQQKNSTPTVSVDKTIVAPGETLIESGQGFSPDSDVLMHFELPNKQTFTASVKTDSSGNYRKDYLVPSNAFLGRYIYYADDLKTNIVSNRINYTVIATTVTKAKKDIQEVKKETPVVKPKQAKAVKQSVQECSFNTSQQPSHHEIIINELAWMGGPSAAGLGASDEWIELKNLTNKPVDISGWQVVSQDENIQAVFKNGSEIPAGGFYLLERSNDDSAPGVTADFIYTGALLNSNEGLRLFAFDCNLVDEILANPNWPAGDNGSKRTMQRSGDLGWSTFGGGATNGIFGTPRAENGPALAEEETVNKSVSKTSSSGGGGSSSGQSATSSQSPLKILINEIQISPIGNRFIELYNPNNSSVDLTDWYLQRKTQSGADFTSLVSKTHFEGKTIGANSYFLISRGVLESADIVLNDLTLTGSSTIQFKSLSGNVVDRVGWGEAQDCEGSCALNPTTDQSIQRKFQNNTFIDDGNNTNDFEIQTCPSPKAASSTCVTSNQAPSALFSFNPQSPTTGSAINLDAASSSDPDGTISLYLWNFGDGATASSTSATTTHVYSSTGNYGVSLTVFDNGNASSTASSTVSVSAAPLAGSVLFEQADERGELPIQALLLMGEAPDSGSFSQLNLKFRTDVAITENERWFIAPYLLFNFTDSTIVYHYDYFALADQAIYCFTTAYAGETITHVFDFNQDFNLIAGKTYKVLIAFKKGTNTDVCNNLVSPVGQGETLFTGYSKADYSNTLIYFQIGN